MLENILDKKSVEDEMAFLSRKILELNKRFMESEQAKSRFLSLVKDELNNPMTVLLGMMNHLKIQAGEKNEKIFNIMSEELLNLDFKIKNIVMAAQIEGGNTDVTNALVDPLDIINEVINSLKYVIKEKNIQISIINSIKNKIATDPQMIYIIAKNLIVNACKYGLKESVVEITLSQDNSLFVLKVRNQGKGPEIDYKPEVFTRFADGPNGEHGLGIGLSVVREICEQLYGSVDYVVEDGFVTFIVQLTINDNHINSKAYGSDEFLFDSFDDAVEL